MNGYVTRLTSLSRLVDLQTIILDTEGSLASIVGDIDASVEVDVTSVLVSPFE